MHRQFLLLIVTIFHILLIPALGSGPTSWKGFQPLDVFEFEYASDPEISPDGSRVAYVRHFSDIQTDRRYTNVWVVNSDGTEQRAVTTGNQHDSGPAWSPDGKRLLYISDEGGVPQLYIRWVDTGEIVRVTNLTEAPSSPAWSPDGAWIAFKALVPEKERSFGDFPAAPSGAKWAKPFSVIDRYMYRYDGVGYAKPGYIHIFVVPSEGGTPRQISTGNFQHGRPWAHAGSLVWSPDGKSILISTNRHDDYELNPMNTEIYEFDVKTRAMRTLTSREGPDSQPAISPDGRFIAYVGFDDVYKSYQLRHLYVMDRNGGSIRQVSPSVDRSFSSPVWTPDGKSLLCLMEDQGVTKIVRVSLEGEMVVVAENVGTGGFAFPYSSSFSVADNGTIAFPITRVDLPGDIAVLDPNHSGPRILTSVNADLLQERALGQVEEVWYTSSLDRRRIQGWIVKPPEFEPSAKYPLILEIHGGPFANYGPRFSFNMQMLASRGFVVLYTNPRGSTSYGEEFANEIHYKYPGDDFYDLNSGVDFMLTKNYIDPDNLFVTGGSGGGVLTCWMVGHTDRFQAAASLYPAINWYAFVLTIDDPLLLKYQFPGLPWDHVEHYEKRNLLSVVRNVKTPTLLLTGDKDYRTPLWEAEQFYRALKLVGVETVLVRAPGEPHGVQSRPSHHMAKLLTVLGWFEEHRR